MLEQLQDLVRGSSPGLSIAGAGDVAQLVDLVLFFDELDRLEAPIASILKNRRHFIRPTTPGSGAGPGSPARILAGPQNENRRPGCPGRRPLHSTVIASPGCTVQLS
ncbi:MAG TPA: hypothetical protein VGU69_10670 [Rhizomicrobium sp.]|nr:hypothetical protein [Rhizomicrobium sp.]